MAKITPEQANAWSNIAAAITGFVVLGLALDFINFRAGAIIAFCSQAFVGILTGKGVPNVQTMIQELNVTHLPPNESKTPIANYPTTYPAPGQNYGAQGTWTEEPPAPSDPIVASWLKNTQQALNEAPDDLPIDTRAGW